MSKLFTDDISNVSVPQGHLAVSIMGFEQDDLSDLAGLCGIIRYQSFREMVDEAENNILPLCKPASSHQTLNLKLMEALAIPHNAVTEDLVKDLIATVVLDILTLPDGAGRGAVDAIEKLMEDPGRAHLSGVCVPSENVVVWAVGPGNAVKYDA